MKSYLTASEIAKWLSVDRATILRWIETGVIKGAIQSEKSGQCRIPLGAYQQLIKQQDESR